MIQSPADRLPAQHCGPQACLCLLLWEGCTLQPLFAWFYFFFFPRQFGNAMSLGSFSPCPWHIRLWGRGEEPGIGNFGFGKLFTGLWITKSGILIKLLSAKLYKVIQEWNLNLNMDCYQITFYIMTTFHVLRWAAHGGCLLPGARLLPAAEPMLINQWIKISLISLLYALWLHFNRKIGKNRIAQNIQSRLFRKLGGHLKYWLNLNAYNRCKFHFNIKNSENLLQTCLDSFKLTPSSHQHY